MKEQEHWTLANDFSEMMYLLMEAEYQEGKLDLDDELKRLKDLAAYSLTHAEILTQREGVELLALAKLFGLTTEPRFHQNQERLSLLTQEAFDYQGQAEHIERQVRQRQEQGPGGRGETGVQRRLFPV